MYPLPKMRQILNIMILILGNKTIKERRTPNAKVIYGFLQYSKDFAFFVA